jgi:hypothetical protein
VALVCENALRQTPCSFLQDVVYAFAASFVPVCHSRAKFCIISGNKGNPDFDRFAKFLVQNRADPAQRGAILGPAKSG